MEEIEVPMLQTSPLSSLQIVRTPVLSLPKGADMLDLLAKRHLAISGRLGALVIGRDENEAWIYHSRRGLQRVAANDPEVLAVTETDMRLWGVWIGQGAGIRSVSDSAGRAFVPMWSLDKLHGLGETLEGDEYFPEPAHRIVCGNAWLDIPRDVRELQVTIHTDHVRVTYVHQWQWWEALLDRNGSARLNPVRPWTPGERMKAFTWHGNHAWLLTDEDGSTLVQEPCSAQAHIAAVPSQIYRLEASPVGAGAVFFATAGRRQPGLCHFGAILADRVPILRAYIEESGPLGWSPNGTVPIIRALAARTDLDESVEVLCTPQQKIWMPEDVHVREALVDDAGRIVAFVADENGTSTLQTPEGVCLAKAAHLWNLSFIGGHIGWNTVEDGTVFYNIHPCAIPSIYS